MHELAIQPISIKFPQDWENPMLEEVCSLVTNGYVGPTRDIYRNSGIPYLVSKNVKPNQIIKEAFAYVDEAFQRANQRSILKEGDVLTVQTGFIGDSCVVPKEFDGANCHALIISRPISDKLHSRWLSEYFNSELGKAAFSQIATGMAHPHLNSTLVRKLRIPIPPYAEQKVAAQILDAIDSTIAHTSTLIAKLKQMKAGLLHDLLTCGLDENGKLRDAIEHPEQFKDSPLGQIPKDWNVSFVNQEFDITAGFTLGEHRRPRKNRQKYLRVANVRREEIVLDDVAELEATHEEVATRLLEENDLLIVEGHANPEEIGRCALVPPAAVNLTFQNHLFRLRSKRLISKFALMWLNGEWVRAYWRCLCGTSSGLNTINRTMLNAIPVPLPAEEEQFRIIAVLDAHNIRISSEESCLSKLKEQKKGLMHDLLTGRVRVTDLQEIPA